MAEEPKVEEVEEKKSSPLVKIILMLFGAILIPAIVACLAYIWLIRPMWAPPEEDKKTVEVVDPLPKSMVEFKFEEQQISVQTEDPDMVAPLLIAQVTLMCRDEATRAVIEARQSLFAAMILKMHRGKTRVELNDPLVQNSVLEQIKQQSNILLRRLDPEADLMVLDALHLKYTVVDL